MFGYFKSLPFALLLIIIFLYVMTNTDLICIILDRQFGECELSEVISPEWRNNH